MGRLSSALIVAYPLVLHVCVSIGQLRLAATYLAVLLLLPVGCDLVEYRRISLVGFACAVSAAAVLTALKTHELLLLKLLPITIHIVLFSLFAGSLRPSRVPVITRIALAMRAEISAEEAHYARKVTEAWGIFFIAMAFVSGYLALFSSDMRWSWFVNVVSYGLIALFFVVEFTIRRRVLGAQVDYGFAEFLVRLRRVDVRKLFWSP